LETGKNEVLISPELAEKASIPIRRMLDFAKTLKK
jgi:quinolinate synthase